MLKLSPLRLDICEQPLEQREDLARREDLADFQGQAEGGPPALARESMAPQCDTAPVGKSSCSNRLALALALALFVAWPGLLKAGSQLYERLRGPGGGGRGGAAAGGGEGEGGQ